MGCFQPDNANEAKNPSRLQKRTFGFLDPHNFQFPPAFIKELILMGQVTLCRISSYKDNIHRRFFELTEDNSYEENVFMNEKLFMHVSL